MGRKCHFCRGELGSNTTVEPFPVSRRVAYDPLQGRLWAVCQACSRWMLAPIETRWEELEWLTTDRARLLAQTENIGLLEVGDVEVVRIGRAALREEAWWRYGREVQRRAIQSRRIVKRGRISEALWSTVLLGIPTWGYRSPDALIEEARDDHFRLVGVAWSSVVRALWRASTRAEVLGPHGTVCRRSWTARPQGRVQPESSPRRNR